MELLNHVFWFAVVITAVVFLHEMGHYLVARFFGVKVSVFSVGFGSEIIGYTSKKTGTRWRISVLPLGGYVKFADDDNIFSAPTKKSGSEDSSFLSNKKPWQRMLIAFAGPGANYLTAFLIFTSAFIILGQRAISTEITEIIPNSPAAKYGLMVGDTVVAFNKAPITDTMELKRLLMNVSSKNPGVILTIKRNDNLISIPIKVDFVEVKDVTKDKIVLPYIGIQTAKYEVKRLSVWQAAREGYKECYSLSASVLVALTQLIVGEKELSSLGGPVKIAQYSNASAEHGIWAFLLFIAAISVNLGLVNLLPLPALDGGHVLIGGIEWIIGRSLPILLYKIIYFIGVILIVTLMGIVLATDMIHLIKNLW